jgi:Ca2+-transporting ATPase
MAIAFGINDWISGVIAFVLLISVAMDSYQVFTASKTRNGYLVTIATEYVVPGDIVQANVGDTVPADFSIIGCWNLETNEALLTGESLPVVKDHTVIYDGVVGAGDRLKIAFSSSVVTKGRAVGIVVIRLGYIPRLARLLS